MTYSRVNLVSATRIRTPRVEYRRKLKQFSVMSTRLWTREDRIIEFPNYLKFKGKTMNVTLRDEYDENGSLWPL